MQWPLRRVLVRGPSMVPTLRHGDTLLVWLRPPRRLRVGAVVVADLPPAGLVVKRVHALHEDGTVWLQGDNPFGSTDSRSYGAVPVGVVRGRVLARVWPPARVPVRSGPSMVPPD